MSISQAFGTQTTNAAERVLPHDMLAEQSVLGALLLSPLPALAQTVPAPAAAAAQSEHDKLFALFDDADARAATRRQLSLEFRFGHLHIATVIGYARQDAKAQISFVEARRFAVVWGGEVDHIAERLTIIFCHAGTTVHYQGLATVADGASM